MNDETRLAFAHPLERAKASSISTQYDRISLRDHIVEVEIGAFQLERGVTQRVSFNIVVEVQPIEQPILDDVDRILSYDRLTEAIAIELGAERLNLLETLAQRIADRILLEPQAIRVFIRIEKLDRGPGALGVEIVRGGRGYAPVAEPEAAHPNIVFISNSALAGQDIADLLSRLHAQNAAVVLCVEAVEGPRTHTSDPIAQAHIDLLSVEQNAWMIATHSDHCDVVATRTELDWAIKNNRLAIWAPTKMVMDATDTFESFAPASLAIWLGHELDAKSCSLIGAKTVDGVNGLQSINDFDISALCR